jgi:hypothetical protein
VRKGVVVIAGMGVGAMAVLALLAGHYLEANPTIGALVRIRDASRDVWGDRIVELTWAPEPTPGAAGHGLRVIFRPTYGPNAHTREQQAHELGRWLIAQWGPGNANTPAIAFVDAKGITDGARAWQRITRTDEPGPVAPPNGTGYPPGPPEPGAGPAPEKPDRGPDRGIDRGTDR